MKQSGIGKETDTQIHEMTDISKIEQIWPMYFGQRHKNNVVRIVISTTRRKKRNFDLNFIPYTKIHYEPINSKWIINLNVKCTIIQLKKKIKEKILMSLC